MSLFFLLYKILMTLHLIIFIPLTILSPLRKLNTVLQI